MIVNQKSWHYYLLKEYGKGRCVEHHYPDSCSYITGVVKTAFAVAAITVLFACVMALTIGDTFAWFAACIAMQTWILADFGAWTTGFIVALTVLSFALDWLKDYIRDRKYRAMFDGDERDFNKPPGFFKQAYDSIHNKYCTRIEVVG